MGGSDITEAEVHALSKMVEQAYTDASFNDLDDEEWDEIQLVSSLLGKLEGDVRK